MLAYIPFLDPLPVAPYWWAVMVVLIVLISLAYKTLKVHDLSQLPRQTIVMTIQVTAFMLVAGAVITLLVAFS